MSTRYIVGEMVSGRRIQNLNVVSGSCSNDLDQAEEITVTVDLGDPAVRNLALRQTAAPGRAFIASIDVDSFGVQNVRGAGPIWTRHYDKAAKTLQLSAKGMLSMFSHRYIIPPAARAYNVTQWTIPDPNTANAGATIPNPALATTVAGVSLGSVAATIVAQAMSWAGGALPIDLPANEADNDPTHTKTYQGTDFKLVGDAITDLMALVDGPEIRFDPYVTSDGLGIRWNMVTGTKEAPLLVGNNVVSWPVTAQHSPVSSFTNDEDGSNMASIGWATGGNQADTVMVSRTEDDTLINAGYPLMEDLDSTHTSVSVQSTLDSYSAAIVLSNATPTENYAFTVLSHPVAQVNGQVVASGPQLGNDFDLGTFIELRFEQYSYDPSTGIELGDPYYLDETIIPMRIVGVSTDSDGIVATIKAVPVVTG